MRQATSFDTVGNLDGYRFTEDAPCMDAAGR